MWWTKSAKPSIKCTRVVPTSHRPGAKGTYIVRLSCANRQRLKARNGAYLKVSYGKASVLARLSVDDELNGTTIRMDQTLRTAICLEKIMTGLAKKELVYNPGGDGDLSHPIVIQRSNFRGPTLLARRLKQQYLICLVHHAIPRDMETPIARLTKQSMDVVGIQPGDKVLLISETRCRSLRCLPLDPKTETQLPLPSMHEQSTPPCPDSAYEGLLLPWITIDWQTRLDLGVVPWQPIIVGRDPRHALALEFNHVAAALALAAVGGAIVIPQEKLQLLETKLGEYDYLGWVAPIVPWVPAIIIFVGLFTVLILILFSIRSRI